jgi:asparagine synthase (glutamine-hydrolysing)
MSGIAVIYNLDGRPADRSLLERMLAAIAYRGPDGISRWFDGPIAIGHAMLHATPESLRERQPLRDESLELCLTFDGRVDNREELAAAIERKGVRLESDTDAELVLRAYQCWEADSPQRILGDFAYALWDGRKRRLFCARDPLGMKPFCYYSDARVFLCGSEMHELLGDQRIKQEPNEAMVGECLSDMLTDREQTLFKNVMRLAPGNMMIVAPDGVIRRSYFSIDLKRQIRYRKDEDYAAHLLELIGEAVRCRMRSPGGIAAELSGGLDSSSVVGMAQKLMRDGRVPKARFETFSLWFSHPDSDERRYIKDVVDMWNLVSNRVEPRIADLATYAEQVRRYKDFPAHPNLEMAQPIKALIRAKGFRVCFSGLGGDEWQTGSDLRCADLLRQLRLKEMIRTLSEDARAAKAAGRTSPLSAGSILRYVLWPLFPESIRKLARMTLRPSPLPRWLEPEFVRRTGLLDRVRQQPRLPRGGTPSQRENYQSLMKAMPLRPLELMELWGSRFGFETRHPLHDLRIIAFALATPDEQCRRGSIQKFAFRQAMRGLLPETVFNRRDKADFTHVFVKTFENLGGEEFFDSLEIASVGWVNTREARDAYREMISFYKRKDLRFARHTWPLFALFGVELWFNSVFLGKGALPRAGIIESFGRRLVNTIFGPNLDLARRAI